MILPFGVGRTWPKIPFVTLTLIVLNFIYYFSGGNFSIHHKKLIQAQLLTEDQEKLIDKTIIHICKQEKEEDFCQSINIFFKNIERNNEKDLFMKWKKLSIKNRKFIVQQRSLIYNDQIVNHDILKIPELIKYRKSINDIKKDRILYIQKNDLLSKYSIGLKQLIVAQFSHTGIFHLSINIFFLIIFAPFVEFFLGKFLFATLYFVGGSLGLGLFAQYFIEPSIPVLGASANIASIIGAFYILFFNQKFRIWMLYRFAHYPVKWSIPIVFFLDEIIGALKVDSSIANQAHIIGYVVGIIFSIPIVFKFRLKKYILYPFELSFIKKVSTDLPLNQKIYFCEKILNFNPNNSMISKQYIKYLIESIKLKYCSTNEEKLIKSLGPHLKLYSKYKKNYFIHLINEVPYETSLSYLLRDASQDLILEIAQDSLNQNYPLLSLRFYESYLIKYPDSNIKSLIKNNIEYAFKEISKNKLSNLNELIERSRNSFFVDTLEELKASL